MRTAVFLLVFILFSAGTSLGRPEAPPRLVERPLERAIMARVLEAGPQRFIASLKVEPAFDHGRFLGYRLLGFTPDSPLVNGAAVVAGDIVVAVNGESLERPEQFMRVWKTVGERAKLELLVRRGAERILYRWAIIP